MTNKRILSAILIMALLVSLAGCANNAAPPAQEQPASSQPEAAAPAAQEEEPTEEIAAPSGEPIKVGVILPLSSAAGTAGGRKRDGVLVAAKQINAKGGILGRPVEVIAEDVGASDPALALSAAEKLIHQDKVVCIIGCQVSSCSLVVLQACEQNGVPMIEPGATSPSITSGSEWICRISSTNQIDAELLGQDLYDLGFTNVAYMPVDSDWGISVMDNYKPVLEALGATTALVEPIATAETNYLAQITKIKNSGADSIIITQDNEGLAIVLRQLAEAGMMNGDYKVLSTSGNSSEITWGLAPGASAGAYFVEYYAAVDMIGGNADSAENVAFTEDFLANNPGTPCDYHVIQGLISLEILAEAIERLGSVDDLSKIRDELRNTNYESLRGNISFDELGQARADVLLTTLNKDGKTEILKRVNAAAAQ